MKDVNFRDVLALEVEMSGGPKTTIRYYLQKILSMVWKARECFDGKRPFGNSGWEYDLYIPLVKAGYVKGALDDRGRVSDIDTKNADKMIVDLIDYIFYTAATSDGGAQKSI